MRKIFIFIILISLNSCSYTDEEIYSSGQDYKAWAVTVDGSTGGYYSYRSNNQQEADSYAIDQCESHYNQICILYMSGNHNVWQNSVDAYNRNIQNEYEKAREKVEEGAPSYSCSGAKCTAN